MTLEHVVQCRRLTSRWERVHERDIWRGDGPPDDGARIPCHYEGTVPQVVAHAIVTHRMPAAEARAYVANLAAALR